jgi:hypothetical protein
LDDVFNYFYIGTHWINLHVHIKGNF